MYDDDHLHAERVSYPPAVALQQTDSAAFERETEEKQQPAESQPLYVGHVDTLS